MDVGITTKTTYNSLFVIFFHLCLQASLLWRNKHEFLELSKPTPKPIWCQFFKNMSFISNNGLNRKFNVGRGCGYQLVLILLFLKSKRQLLTSRSLEMRDACRKLKSHATDVLFYFNIEWHYFFLRIALESDYRN